MAEHSMAGAHSEHLARGDTDYVTLDGGFTAPRNAHGCTMAAHVRIDMDADVDVDIDTDRYNTGRAFQPRAPLAAVDDMSVPALKAELAVQGLADKGIKAELRLQVAAARADIAAVRIAQAVPLARRSLPDMPRGSPRRLRSDVVLPLHGLPSPYRLPASQQKKRMAPPPGQRQYTAGRLATSLAMIAAGELSTPLKRSRVEPHELVQGEG
jgi:hypothetical protein